MVVHVKVSITIGVNGRSGPGSPTRATHRGLTGPPTLTRAGTRGPGYVLRQSSAGGPGQLRSGLGQVWPDSVFQALGDPTRRALLERLGDGPLSVSDLAAPLAVSLETGSPSAVRSPVRSHR
ncbi:MAG: Helix-turn-helix domain [Propionibacteriaceae bacterium]|nr:Helix-turn-helix domain [Propionibacteriaceae bacterium]